jgi:tetratricopeptide (TPR) repeat protein
MLSPPIPEGFSCKGTLARFCCVGIVCLLLPTAHAAAASGSGQEAGGQAGLPKMATPARDDLPQLDRLEIGLRSGKFQEVQTPLRDYLKAHPQSARAYYDLGYASFRTHQLRVSVEALSKSLQLDLDNPEAHKILGLDLIIIGKNDEAQVEMEEASRLEPNSAEIHYFLGRIHFTRAAYQLAKQEFEEAIRLDPSYVKAYDNLGLTMEGLGDDNAALTDFEKAFALMERQGKKSEWPYVNACAMYNRQNEPERALGYCQTAIQINPKNDQAYFEIARAHMAQQRWEQAATALQSAIQNNARYARYHYVLSTVYRKMGKTADSQREVETFQKLSSQGAVPSPQAHDDRARSEPNESREVDH